MGELMNTEVEAMLARAEQQRDQLRESLRWALDVAPWAYPTEKGTCAVCEAFPHTPDCSYARALKLLEEKPSQARPRGGGSAEATGGGQ